MYPELTVPLLVGVAFALGALSWVVLRYPFLRRLAARQLRRRRTEALLVVSGSLLGTTMIVASLVVGDTLDHSVRGIAYSTLGPVDERVVSLDRRVGAEVARRLAPLAHDPDVDGVLTLTTTTGASLRRAATGERAEPRTTLWEADFTAAAAFGGGDSGLSGAAPAAGTVVVNSELAETLDVSAGDEITVFPFAVPTTVRIARVVETRGLAGIGPGDVNRNVFVPAGTLAAAARAAERGQPASVTFVSNRGGVESGNALSDRVTRRIEALLAGAPAGASVEQPKQAVLQQAESTAAVLGSVFLFISSFSIIAGVLLLVNVFVMLAEERKAEIGMLRAIGLRRGRLTGLLLAEGSVYAAVASVVGVATGVLVGRGVVVVAARVFRSWSSGGLSNMTFAVRPASLVNGAAMGFLIAFVTVALASARISRTNIIAAIRDLDSGGARSMRLRTRVACLLGVVVFGAASVPAVASSSGPMTYAMPGLAIVCAVPLLARRLPKRAVYSGAALLVLLWALLANTIRPDVFDDPTTTTYTILGSMLSFAAVVLISENQRLVLWPFRRLVDRPSEAGLAARLAVAYPTAKRFRTGATLAMYALVVFTLVLMTEITGIMNAGISGAVRDTAGRYAIRADFAVPPSGDAADLVRGTAVGGAVTGVTPMRTITATADDPGGRWTTDIPVVAVGVTDAFASEALSLDERLPAYADDAAAWRAVARDPALVVVSPIFGSTGGPVGDAFSPGSPVTVKDPRTGREVRRTIAAIMSSDMAFDGISAGFAYPVLMSDVAVREQFGAAATPSTLLLTLRPGTDPEVFATRLQGSLVSSGVRATSIEATVRRNFAANQSFFQLMQGFLGLGLVVGITGLGVVMVRAVRERRRTIGVLRALGFRARTVRRSFLAESSLVAAEGILSGAVLAVVTSWLLFVNSPVFGSLAGPFPVAWVQIGGIVVVTFVASMLATLGPANRAAKIRPALALRISD